MVEITNAINAVLWSPVMVVLCLSVGIIYSLVLKFPQIRLFKSMVHYLMRGSASEDGISSFQAFAMALDGRVGVGNISGVATALTGAAKRSSWRFYMRWPRFWPLD